MQQESVKHPAGAVLAHDVPLGIDAAGIGAAGAGNVDATETALMQEEPVDGDAVIEPADDVAL